MTDNWEVCPFEYHSSLHVHMFPKILGLSSSVSRTVFPCCIVWAVHTCERLLYYWSFSKSAEKWCKCWTALLLWLFGRASLNKYYNLCNSINIWTISSRQSLVDEFQMLWLIDIFINFWAVLSFCFVCRLKLLNTPVLLGVRNEISVWHQPRTTEFSCYHVHSQFCYKISSLWEGQL